MQALYGLALVFFDHCAPCCQCAGTREGSDFRLRPTSSGTRLTCVLQGSREGSRKRVAGLHRHSQAAPMVATADPASSKAAEQAGGKFCLLQQARLGILLREGPLRLILAGGGVQFELRLQLPAFKRSQVSTNGDADATA